MNDGFSSGRNIPGLPQTPASDEETVTGDTSTTEAPAVGDSISGGDDRPVEEPAGEPGEGGVTPDEEQEAVSGDDGGEEAPEEPQTPEAPQEGAEGDPDAVPAEGEGDETPDKAAPADGGAPESEDGELRAAGGGEDELRAAPVTAGDNIPGQAALHERMAAAEDARGEAPFATPQMAEMVDTAPNGGTTVKTAVETAEANAQTGLNTAHAANVAAASAWRAERGIDLDDRHTRELRTTTD